VHHGIRQGHACEACHGPASKHLETDGKTPGLVWSFKALTAPQKSEICVRCHEQDACEPGAQWRTSLHAHWGLSCLDCHTAHYERQSEQPQASGESERRAPAATADRVASLAAHREAAETKPAAKVPSNNLGAVSPDVCYRCHGDMADLQRLAGPHQIGGPHGFNCTSCHDAHGNTRPSAREEMCQSCHQSHSPTMAWHSSTHGIAGVACTDCHNPHPRSDVPARVDIQHASVQRPRRRPMSVQEPEACYKCHPTMFALANLPSHHPVAEGKMRCSDCHEAHGQNDKGLREPTVNLLCYRCHAEKQGPFAYEHPPVTEDCGICHEPHGTVSDYLLRQPATFLCLRCHSGHRSDHRQLDDPDNAVMREALYADCTQCHSQVHGSDLINETLRGRGLSR
jgi:DmsE family decaheme c-type cytochrome